MGQVTVQKIVEGASHLVVQVGMLSDGSGELTNYPILSPADLSPPEPLVPKFRIMQVWYGLVWFDVTLGSSLVQPVTLWTLARDCDSHTDFRSFGGMFERRTSPPNDANGVLWISTNNFAPPGSQGQIVLELRKTYQPQ